MPYLGGPYCPNMCFIHFIHHVTGVFWNTSSPWTSLTTNTWLFTCVPRQGYPLVTVKSFNGSEVELEQPLGCENLCCVLVDFLVVIGG